MRDPAAFWTELRDHLDTEGDRLMDQAEDPHTDAREAREALRRLAICAARASDLNSAALGVRA